jgi:hypothetical protein
MSMWIPYTAYLDYQAGSLERRPLYARRAGCKGPFGRDQQLGAASRFPISERADSSHCLICFSTIRLIKIEWLGLL